MRVLVYPHDLDLGGSQLNAIELAAAVRDLGHDVVTYGQPGVLNGRIDELGLEFIQSPPPRLRPTPGIAAHLRRVVKDREVDIIHGYEWPPTLEARCAVAGTPAAALSTVMSMAVAPFIPRDMPLVVGTEQIAAVERASGRRSVTVIEPPVDTEYNAPGLGLDTAAFLHRFGLARTSISILCVTRLAHELKLEGLLTAIDVVSGLDDDVTLTIVGDGPAAAQVRAAATVANRRAGRRAVVLTGPINDPRAAYASADIFLGMGGSALRALAFGKPLIVQGEHGYWRTLTPESLPTFLWTGWFGFGEGSEAGRQALRRELGPLLADRQLRQELGRFGRRTVVERFSLRTAARRQVEVYERAVTRRSRRRAGVRHDVAAACRLVVYTGRQIVGSKLGLVATDDFNAAPVTTAGPGPLLSSPQPLVVYIAGVSKDSVQGTDHRLVEHLASTFPLLWVDPIRPWRYGGVSQTRSQCGVPGLSQEEGNLWRLSVIGPPGATRAVVRDMALVKLRRRISQAQVALGARRTVAVGSSPLFPLKAIDADRRIFLATDDFEAGAELMGLSQGRLRRLLEANVRDADAVLAVSAVLQDQLRSLGADVRLLPNGCAPERFAPGTVPRAPEVALPSPIAGVVGHLNDRIDSSLLLSLARTGASLLLVGPLVARERSANEELSELVRLPNVQWVGNQPYERVPQFILAMDVGLTPYRDTAFNRASFPLKTLEYLSAGLPVVSTDLPSARWLGTSLVHVAGHERYVDIVLKVLAQPNAVGSPQERRAFAATHSWAARAEELAAVILPCSARDTRTASAVMTPQEA